MRKKDCFFLKKYGTIKYIAKLGEAKNMAEKDKKKLKYKTPAAEFGKRQEALEKALAEKMWICLSNASGSCRINPVRFV